MKRCRRFALSSMPSCNSDLRYARVATDGRSVAAQMKPLCDAGAEKLSRETASGAKTDRAQLCRASARLDQDDVLLASSFERLARSTRDPLNTLAAIVAKSARFRSLGDASAAAAKAHGRLISGYSGFRSFLESAY